MPDDVLREAANRLGIISLVGVALWTLGGTLGHLSLRALGDPRWRQLLVTDAIVAAGVLTSFALFLYSRRSRRSPQFLLDLGLVYLVVTAFDIGVLWHWSPLLESHRIEPMFTWVGPLVLMFAAIIPNAPGKTFVASLIAAAMSPVGMLIARERGVWEFGSLGNVMVMHYPDFIMVGVAVVISFVVTRLGQQIVRAREMGSYHVGELLSRGGMGEIYRATHRMLARPAAIKLIRPEVLGAGNPELAETALRRFRREAEVAASLRSPHTVELYDFGIADDQRLYFVMELLDGMDLQELVTRHGPQPAARVIHILRQICESLEEAHSRGLVHRDIKPPNIHLGRLGLRHDFVKVLDFGLVKPASGVGAERSLGTAADVTPGTPAYMAPEMALSEHVDGRADLYALGCVAYYLLTGRVVFESLTALQAIARHINDVPAAPSSSAKYPVPPALDALVLRLLSKRPEERPASAAEVSRALAAIDVEPWGEEDAARWWREVAARPAESSEPEARSPAAAPLRVGVPVGSVVLAILLSAAPAHTQSVQYRSPAGVEYASLPDTGAVARAEQALAAEPRNVDRFIQLGVAQSGARQFREAIETFTRAIAIAPDNALLYRWRGHRYLSVRDLARAAEDLARAARLDSTLYGAWYHLGIVHFARADFSAAADAFARARPRAPDRGELAGANDWLWMSLARAGRTAEAKAVLDGLPDSLPETNAYTRRLQLYQGRIGPEDVITVADSGDVTAATLSYALGNWYLVQGDTIRGRAWFERAIRTGGWPAFGFILAEIELDRLKQPGR